MKPATPEAYKLLHDGSIAMAEIECNGMCIDTDYVARITAETKVRLKDMRVALEKSDVMGIWRKRFGTKTNINSAAQLGDVLFKDMGFVSTKETSGGRESTDEEVLSTIEHPFVRDYLKIKKLTKAVNTNLKGIMEEVVDGMIHCFFNLHTTVTYRSSSDSFNFQNIPKHDEEIAKIVRRAFIARPGRQIVEVDFKGIEVCVGACYHKDARMLEYIHDKSTDMHRDMAQQLYKLDPAEMTGEIRYSVKGGFVFAEFYGNWYKACAENLWKSAGELKTKSGLPLRKHLKRQGLRELGHVGMNDPSIPGSFEEYVQEVEHDFWHNRFAGYGQWKIDWYNAYKQKGYFHTLTGFVCQGYMRKNEVNNYCIQGSAFHCLLWAAIQIMRELKRHGMKSVIVGQIHDSIVGDIVPSELKEFLEICYDVIRRRLPKAWPWIITPMDVEAEVAPVGGSWADKEKYELK